MCWKTPQEGDICLLFAAEDLIASVSGRVELLSAPLSVSFFLFIKKIVCFIVFMFIRQLHVTFHVKRSFQAVVGMFGVYLGSSEQHSWTTQAVLKLLALSFWY